MIKLDILSDPICPWCLIGKTNLDKAIFYLNAAAAQGQVNAMTTVGWTYFTGDHGAP